LINQTEQSYQELSARIISYLGSPPASQALIPELRRQLQAGDIKVQKLLNQQTGEIRILLGEAYDPFERMISNFDFESALALLEQTKTPENQDASV
jgi:hypothetical protein